MKIFICFIILLMSFSLVASDALEIFVFNHPKYDFYDYNAVNSWQDSITVDSLKQIHIFSGEILSDYIDDVFPLTFLQQVKCDLALPTDYLFHKTSDNMHFKLLASNITSDSLLLFDHFITETDSMKIGFFSIYTPDLAVKNQFSSKAEINYKVFQLTAQYAEALALKCDYVVMLSSLSKIIDVDIVKDLPIDLVISFDYQTKKSGLLAGGKTQYISVNTANNKVGKISLEYDKGNISSNLTELDQKLADEPVFMEEKAY